MPRCSSRSAREHSRRTTTMILIGIDPGASGGVAIFDANTNQIELFKCPETETEIAHLFRFIVSERARALIEKVHAMPGQGVTSMFSFGRNYGFLRGCLIAFQIPFDEIPPQRWQKALGCLTKGDKNVSKAKAQQLYPKLKITHATADALCILEYLRRTTF